MFPGRSIRSIPDFPIAGSDERSARLKTLARERAGPHLHAKVRTEGVSATSPPSGNISSRSHAYSRHLADACCPAAAGPAWGQPLGARQAASTHNARKPSAAKPWRRRQFSCVPGPSAKPPDACTPRSRQRAEVQRQLHLATKQEGKEPRHDLQHVLHTGL
jgi:hypothetical protein